MKLLHGKGKILILSALILGLLIVFSNQTANKKTRPLAQNGFIDLSEWDFQKDGPIKLKGQWEFYWSKLLNYEDFQGSDISHNLDAYVKVPGVWNNYKIDDNKLPGEGFATYRLKIKSKASDDMMGFKILTESTAYNLFINGELISTSGQVGENKNDSVPEYKPHTVYFKNDTDEYEVIIQISNFSYSRGGFWHPLELGTFDQINKINENSIRKEILLFGAVCSMIIYHMAIYRIQRRNKSILYFILAFFGMALRIFFTGEYYITSLISNISFNVLIFIEYMTIFWGATIWFNLVNELYPDEAPKKVVRVFNYISLGITLFILLTPISVYTKYITLIEGFVVITTLNILYSIIKAVYRKKKWASLLFWGSALFFATYIHDSLYYLNLIQSKPGGWIGYTTFIMLFIQSYILAARYSKSFDDVIELSDKMISVNKLKDEFLANTSHELRTPLHGMISITESVLQNTEGKINQKQKENLNLVVSSGRRLANLVNEILDYSKLKYGDINLSKNTIDLSQLVEIVFAEQKYLMESKDIIFINNIPLGTFFVYGDEDRLIQILYNLIGNGVKFTEDGEIIISAVENKDMVEVTVEDTGIGIEEDKLEDIFESFEQGNLSSTKVYGGIGLGLSIVKQLVEIHGGDIWVTSILGEGSKFTFSLIKSREKNANLQSLKRKSLRSTFKDEIINHNEDGDYNILIVDDDYVNLHSLVNILSDDNHSLITASSGVKALDIISNNKEIDLVILDIMMPKMSGYEVCKKIRENYSLYDLPVLMLTAQNNPDAILTGFESGANDFLPKPFEMSELRARVNTLIKLKKSVNHAIHSEMAFLQAQIKPHFLYNALNTIVSFCWTDPEKAAELITDLSNYLRGSFNFSNMEKFVRIEREIELVKSYLAIEEARFEDRIRINYELDDVNFMIPSLVLQPIVENAVKHGILRKSEGGLVNISIEEKHSFVEIRVEDDGVGIEKDKLSLILSEKASGDSVGLKNVIKRLKHIYGYGLEIESEIDEGTVVTIKIPKDMEDSHDQNYNNR
ncbi:MAG: ATP-binding protein [Firmicutes bacterium]|jgi:signal transduction histidine kinase|nr:ATP-binding protein [Bacillota bacterium]